MVSVASGGAKDRITARILFKVLRAGSGTRATYSSTSFGAALRFAAEPRARAFAFFIRGILQKRSFQVHASDSSVRAGHYPASIPAQRFMVLSSSRPESSLHRGCAQLHFVEFAAYPGLRHGKHDECEGIPVGPAKAGPLFQVTAAPTMLTTRPRKPPAKACCMGRSG